MDLDHERRLTEVESRAENNERRLDKVEERQEQLGELVTSVAALAQREERVEKDVKEIKVDVKTLTDKPAKHWDSLVEKIILTVAGGVVGYILSQIIPGM